MSNEKALKSDGNKADLSLNPLCAQEAMARAFMFGEKKYARYNYCNGFESHRLIGAALRHLNQWQDGEDLDPESGITHLGHALASIAMLIHTQQLGTNKDTRRGKSTGVPVTTSQQQAIQTIQPIFLDEVPDGHVQRKPIYDRHTNSTDDDVIQY